MAAKVLPLVLNVPDREIPTNLDREKKTNVAYLPYSPKQHVDSLAPNLKEKAIKEEIRLSLGSRPRPADRRHSLSPSLSPDRKVQIQDPLQPVRTFPQASDTGFGDHFPRSLPHARYSKAERYL